MSDKTKIIFQQISDLVKSSVRKKKNVYNLHSPFFQKYEKLFLKDCIESTYVATTGKYINLFENRLKRIIRSNDLVTILNGTIALKVCLKVLGINSGDEVLVPSLTFVGTVNAIKHAGGTPHFIDTDINNLGVDNNKLVKYLKSISKKNNKGELINKKTKKKIFGIIPVHVFGNVGEIDKLCKISKKYNLKVIEDAAESLGSYYKERHVGNFGDLGILSFNANKVITTGSGGAIICNSKTLGKKIRHLTSTAKIPHSWEFLHDEVGWNYKMNNLSSALGYAQIKNIDKIIKLKKNLSMNYKKNIKKYKYLKFFNEPINCKSNNWLNVISVKNISLNQRNEILFLLNKKRIRCRPVWRLIHKLRMYKNYPRSDLSNAIKLEKTLFCLPSGAEHG